MIRLRFIPTSVSLLLSLGRPLENKHPPFCVNKDGRFKCPTRFNGLDILHWAHCIKFLKRALFFPISYNTKPLFMNFLSNLASILAALARSLTPRKWFLSRHKYWILAIGNDSLPPNIIEETERIETRRAKYGLYNAIKSHYKTVSSQWKTSKSKLPIKLRLNDCQSTRVTSFHVERAESFLVSTTYLA